MKTWGVVGVVAALAIIGCGGGGSGTGAVGGGAGGGVAGGGAAVPTILLPNVPGLAEVAYLTGQARGKSRAPGDLTAVVRFVELTDQFGNASEPLDQALNLPLKGFQFQTKRINVPFSGQNSRLFESISLDFLQFNVEGSGPVAPPAGFPLSLPARFRTMPGRNSMIPIYLDDAIFTNPGGIAFDRALFQQINQPDGPSAPINGFLSDYLSFDISGMAPADKPVLGGGGGGAPSRAAGGSAGRVFFSGDNYALSTAGTSGEFQALTLDPATPVVGNFGPPGTIGGPNGGGSHPGTFSLLGPNPIDLTNTMKIVALQGIWRDYTSVVGNLSNFFVLALPSSSDNNFQELVFIARNGATITQFYYGYADYSAGTFRAYPLKNLPNADVTGELLGTITGLTGAGGASTALPSAVRNGNFQFAAGAALPAGFTSSGKFTVFRR